MRLSKKFAAIAITAGVALTASAAFAYWSTSGSGSGAASTETRNTAGIQVNQVGTLDAMYPGDSAQDLTFNLQNLDAHQTLHVASVSVAVTDVKRGATDIFTDCDASNFTIDQPANADVAQEVAALTTSGTVTSGSIHFNDKGDTLQNACQNASVVLTYTAS